MVTLSSTEAEYISLAETAQEALWTIRVLFDLNHIPTKTIIHEDNQSCIQLLQHEE